MLSKQSLSSKTAIIALLVLLVFLGDLKFKQWQRQREINQQKEQIQKQADALQKKNEDLTQSLSYLNSSSFKERVARQQLSYKKQGETVYGFADAPQAAPVQSSSDDNNSNFSKWWNYFFSD